MEVNSYGNQTSGGCYGQFLTVQGMNESTSPHGFPVSEFLLQPESFTIFEFWIPHDDFMEKAAWKADSSD